MHDEDFRIDRICDCGRAEPFHSSAMARDSIAKQALANLGGSCYNSLGFSDS